MTIEYRWPASRKVGGIGIFVSTNPGSPSPFDGAPTRRLARGTLTRWMILSSDGQPLSVCVTRTVISPAAARRVKCNPIWVSQPACELKTHCAKCWPECEKLEKTFDQ